MNPSRFAHVAAAELDAGKAAATDRGLARLPATISAVPRRVALVIGNADYKIGKLINPANDARAIHGALTKLDFQVASHPLIDQGLRETRRAIAEFRQIAQGADIAIVYFAGHGVEIDGQNYLVPADAVLGDVKFVRAECVALSELLDELEGITRLRLIILDACRNNPYKDQQPFHMGQRALSGGLSSIAPAPNTLVLYAAKHASTARDGPPGANSPFVQALLQYLMEPGLELKALIGHVRDKVFGLTNGAQEPWTYGSFGGEEIYLKPPDDPAQGMWKQIRNGGDLEAIQRFIDRFADHPLRLDAISLLNAIKHDQAWKAALSENTLQCFTAFAAYYPHSEHIAAARTSINRAEGDAYWPSISANPKRYELRYFLKHYPHSTYYLAARDKFNRPRLPTRIASLIGRAVGRGAARLLNAMVRLFTFVGRVLLVIVGVAAAGAGLAALIWIGSLVYQAIHSSRQKSDPAEQKDTSDRLKDITTSPLKMDDRWIVYPTSGKDAGGKLANFVFFTLDTSFHWVTGKTDTLTQTTAKGERHLALRELARYLKDALARPLAVPGQTISADKALDLISIGTASQEGDSAAAESARAYARAIGIAKLLSDSHFFNGGIWVLNLGQYKKELGASLASKKQRPVIVVAVLAKEAGVELGVALANAMIKRKGELPHPEDYTEFVFLAFR